MEGLQCLLLSSFIHLQFFEIAINKEQPQKKEDKKKKKKAGIWGDFRSSFATSEREKRGRALPLSIFYAKVCIELYVRTLGVLGWMWTL